MTDQSDADRSKHDYEHAIREAYNRMNLRSIEERDQQSNLGHGIAIMFLGFLILLLLG